jgi:signal transduction histidine kinase
MVNNGPPPRQQDRPDSRSPGERSELERTATLRDTLAGLPDHLGLLEGLFSHSPVPYSVFAVDGHCLLTNPAHRAMFGSGPPPDYNVFRDEVARRLGLTDLLRRGFAGEKVELPAVWYDPKELEHTHVPDGRRVAIACTCFPLRGQGGEVRYVVVAFRDVTAEWTIRDQEEERRQLILQERERLMGELAEERGRLRALADTSTALAKASAGFREALEELARLASDTLGECSVLTLLSDDRSELEVMATYHPDPEARQLLKDTLNDSYSNEGGPAMRVARTGQPIRVAQVPQEGMLESLTPQTRPFVQRYGLHSFLLVPLRAQGTIIGTMGTSRGIPDRPYTQEDQDFLQDMADRAGLVIQNVRLLRMAQEAVRLRDDFLSIASHELKTPLTPLSLKLQVLARLSDSEQEGDLTRRLSRDVEAMRRQVRRLSDLINDLLDVTRISSGRMTLELEEVELSGVVREVASRFEPEAERAGGKLDVHLDGPLIGRWDRLRLEQVVANLLSNALKYGQGKPIQVRVDADSGLARLTVRDEGIGIEPEHQARIFEKFERAVSGRHYGGLGLGLYISQQIINALGGRIGVESRPQQGTVFTVELPLRGPGAFA